MPTPSDRFSQHFLDALLSETGCSGMSNSNSSCSAAAPLLQCTVLHCTARCYTVLHCTAPLLQCMVLRYTALHCTALHPCLCAMYCTVRYCTALCCIPASMHCTAENNGRVGGGGGGVHDSGFVWKFFYTSRGQLSIICLPSCGAHHQHQLPALLECFPPGNKQVLMCCI